MSDLRRMSITAVEGQYEAQVNFDSSNVLNKTFPSYAEAEAWVNEQIESEATSGDSESTEKTGEQGSEETKAEDTGAASEEGAAQGDEAKSSDTQADQDSSSQS